MDSPEDGSLKITVSDEAGGLPKEVQNSLFKPFVTVGKRSGTGLGLSIVKRFIDDHRGRVDVQSTESVGTTFTVIIPKQSDRDE